MRRAVEHAAITVPTNAGIMPKRNGGHNSGRLSVS